MSGGIHEIALSAIALDWDVYPREDIDENRILEFRDLIADPEAVGLVPPVELVPDPEQPGMYRIADGVHRLHAFLDEGRAGIPAVVLPAGTDVFLHAVKRAAISAKPLTRAEKRAAVHRILAEHPDWSNHRIADELGVSRPFVAQVRRGEHVAMAPEQPASNVAPGSASVDDADSHNELAPPNLGPDLAQLALRQLVRAYRKGYGRAKFGFGKQVSPKTIRRFVERLHDEDRAKGIQALQEWGAALADHGHWLPDDGGA